MTSRAIGTTASREGLPAVLRGAIRRALIYQVGIICGFETIFVLGSLSAQRLAANDLLYGLSTVTIFAVGQLLASLPSGHWMDRWGRRRVLLVGAGLETAALVMSGLAVAWGVVPLFLMGLLALGLGSGTAQLVNLVGGDLYPPSRRAEGLSLMTTFSAVGVVAGPSLVGFMGDAAGYLGLDPIASPWFLAAAIVAVAVWAMATLRPEPLDVAKHPERYFGAGSRAAVAERPPVGAGRNPAGLLRLYPVLAATSGIFLYQGVRMSIVPLLTLILSARGGSLTLGATMVAAMGLGMIAGSYPSGWLGDHWGRKRVLQVSTAVGLVCTVIVPVATSLLLMFAALLALGAAFAAFQNMTRTMLADVTRPEERGTAFAATFVAVGISVIIFPTLASYVRIAFGWRAIAIVGAALLLVIFALMSRLREPTIGRWDHPGVE